MSSREEQREVRLRHHGENSLLILLVNEHLLPQQHVVERVRLHFLGTAVVFDEGVRLFLLVFFRQFFAGQSFF